MNKKKKNKKTQEKVKTLSEHFTSKSGAIAIKCKFTRDGFIPLTEKELEEEKELKDSI